jgi:carnitine 3-dehydrogenase
MSSVVDQQQPEPPVPTTFAAVGGGVIGGGWIARFLMMGCNVNVYDPDPGAERKINQMLVNARRSLPGLYETVLPREGVIQFCSNIAQTVSDANWITESVPERLEVKHQTIGEIQRYCRPDAIIASSTSGFKPSELQQGSPDPDQIIVAHPFNPVYLIPLVELVGATNTTSRASVILSQLGMHPLVVRKEIDAHIADRLLEAVWREALWLVNDGVATTTEIDDAIRYGFGLRWAQMGLFETYRIAGGEAGMAHFIAQFGPALKWPWTKLIDVPELSEHLISTIASQSDEQSGHYTITELEHTRDDNLVAMMRALKDKDWAAGNLLNRVDAELEKTNIKPTESLVQCAEVLTIYRVIPSSWLDYNGHMNDSRYAEVFSKASDIILRRLGADAGYIARGYSYFTVDMKIDYLGECHAEDKISVFTSIKLAEGKKLDLYHEMKDTSGKTVAKCSQFLLHVDLKSRKSCMPEQSLATVLKNLDYKK